MSGERDDTTAAATGRQGGMVTAEAAFVLPLIGLFVLVLVWLLTIGIADVRVVDAARDAARTLATGAQRSTAVGVARRTAGAGAVVQVRRADGLVTVDVSRRVSAPGWLLVPLPSVVVRGHSSVVVEHAPPS